MALTTFIGRKLAPHNARQLWNSPDVQGIYNASGMAAAGEGLRRRNRHNAKSALVVPKTKPAAISLRIY
jgi:hypothetical protein